MINKETIDNAIEIIKYAVKNNISVYKASEENGKANTYVKNVKARLYKLNEIDEIDDDLFLSFKNAYDEYIDSCQNTKVEPNQQNNVFPIETIKGNKTSVEEKSTHTEITYSGNQIKTLDALLDAMEVDRNIWEVKSKVVNSWDTTAFNEVDGIKTPITHTNFQVKARLEKIKEEADSRNVANIFKELVKDYKPPLSAYNSPASDNTKQKLENNLLEINLFDLHIGKLGWAGEVDENYDTKIAVARFQDAIKNLIKRAEGFEYSKILFPIGNDFFNSDNLHNTTTKGTPQDEDLRWQKTFKMGCQLIVDGINLLKSTGVPVDVLIVPGNHDFERSYYLGTVIEAWFRDDKQVNVNNAANPRKYYEFGEVLIGLTHGNEEKESSLPLLMASEMKEAWGRTTFHEWHLGHFHRKRNINYAVFDKAQMLNEDYGVIVRYLSSLSGTEEWHYKKGYVGSSKAGEAFIWNDKTGMIGHLNFNFTEYDREI